MQFIANLFHPKYSKESSWLSYNKWFAVPPSISANPKLDKWVINAVSIYPGEQKTLVECLRSFNQTGLPALQTLPSLDRVRNTVASLDRIEYNLDELVAKMTIVDNVGEEDASGGNE